MLDSLVEPFRQALMQRALVEVLVLGAVCGPLGTWVVLLRRSYAAESFSHAMFPGLVVAALSGAPLLLGAAAGVLAAAAGVALAGRDRRVGGDAAVAVVVTALLGLGALLALSPRTPARLAELLFGDVLGATTGELAAIAALAAAVLAVLVAAHRALVLAAFDPGAARSLGARPAAAELLLLALLGLTIVAAVQALGNLLVVALLLAPGTGALLIARRVGSALGLSALLAAGAGVGGLYASYYLDTAAGASIAAAALLVCALAALVPSGARAPRPARGVRRSPIEAMTAPR